MGALEHATTEELDRVFERVTKALDGAGIPWFDDIFLPDHSAAKVVLDDLDGGRGVYLYWQPSREESAAAVSAHESGDWDDPEIDRVGSMAKGGMGRLAAALSAAGILTKEKDDDMNPFTLEVIRVL